MYASAAEERAERSQSIVSVNGIAVVAIITRLSIDAVFEVESIILCYFWCHRGQKSEVKVEGRDCQERFKVIL